MNNSQIIGNDSYTPIQHETNIKKEKKFNYDYMQPLLATPILALIKFIPTTNRIKTGLFSVTLIGAIMHGTWIMSKSFGGQEDKDE